MKLVVEEESAHILIDRPAPNGLLMRERERFVGYYIMNQNIIFDIHLAGFFRKVEEKRSST